MKKFATTWICDKCGDQAVVNHDDIGAKDPAGWHTEVYDEGFVRRGYVVLCPVCYAPIKAKRAEIEAFFYRLRKEEAK